MQNAYRNAEKRQTGCVSACVCVCVLIEIMRKGWGREGVSSAASDEAVQTGAKGQKQMHDAGAVTHCLGPAHCPASGGMDT